MLILILGLVTVCGWWALSHSAGDSIEAPPPSPFIPILKKTKVENYTKAIDIDFASNIVELKRCIDRKQYAIVNDKWQKLQQQLALHQDLSSELVSEVKNLQGCIPNIIKYHKQLNDYCFRQVETAKACAQKKHWRKVLKIYGILKGVKNEAAQLAIVAEQLPPHLQPDKLQAEADRLTQVYQQLGKQFREINNNLAVKTDDINQKFPAADGFIEPPPEIGSFRKRLKSELRKLQQASTEIATASKNQRYSLYPELIERYHGKQADTAYAPRKEHLAEQWQTMIEQGQKLLTLVEKIHKQNQLMAPGNNNDTPAKYFQERLARMNRQTITFDQLSPNLRLANEILTIRSEKQATARLEKIVELKIWSWRQYGFELPIWWEQSSRKYWVMKGQLQENTADALLRFSYYYLCAYANLDADLRQSNSPLAVGAAALVAAEVVYHEHWACLPQEIQQAAAITNILALYCPEIIPACFAASNSKLALTRRSLVANAVTQMCMAQKDAVMAEIHHNLKWLQQKALGEQTINLVDFLPPHPQSLQVLLGKVEKQIHNLTLQALIVQALCFQLYGIGNEDSGRQWNGELKKLLELVREEMRQRCWKTQQWDYLAPNYDQSHKLVWGDPGLLRPLLVIAGHASVQDLQKIYARIGREKDWRPQALLQGLKQINDVKEVLALAGSDPQIKIEFKNDEQQAKVAKITLTWSNLARDRSPNPGDFRPETIKVDLINYDPTGIGKPITGVWVNHWVTVLKKGREAKIRAGAVQPMMKIRGFINAMPLEEKYATPFPPGSQDSVVPSPQAVWFTVLARQKHKISMTQTLGIENGKQHGEVKLARPHHILLAIGKTKSWRQAKQIDIGSEFWHSSARLQYTKKCTTATELIEFSLIWENEKARRGQANNYLLATAPGPGGVAIIVRARSADVGPIDETALILVGNDHAVKPLREVKANDVVEGYHLKKQDDPWPNPSISRHRICVEKKNTTKWQKATDIETTQLLALTFIDDQTLILSPFNWFLTRSGQNQIKEIPAILVREGMQLLTQTRPGAYATIQVKKIEKLTPDRNLVLLECQNLKWAKIGPVIVSVDFRNYDQEKVGMHADTKLALPQFIKKQEQQLPEKRITQISSESILIKDKQRIIAQKQKLVFWDPQLQLLVAANAKEYWQVQSRRLISLVAQKGQTTRTLRCAPSQPLWVRSAGGACALEYAHAIKPGTDVYVAEAGSNNAMPWPVVNLTPLFCPPEILYEITSASKMKYFWGGAAQTDIVIADNIAVVLKEPAAGANKRRDEEPGQPGSGNAGGQSQGANRGGGPTTSIAPGGLIPLIFPVAGQDPIKTITENAAALKQLKARGKDLLTILQAEIENRSKNAGSNSDNNRLLKFWQRQLPADWDWPFHQQCQLHPQALGDYLQKVLQVRNYFLEHKAYSIWLGPLLFQESIAASLVHEYGCRETAALLCQDIIELTFFAACEKGKEKQRRGRELSLPLMLQMPYFLGIYPAGKDQVALGAHVSEVVNAWLDYYSKNSGYLNKGRIIYLDEEKKSSRISLSRIRGFLAISLEGDWNPEWTKLAPPDAQGNIGAAPRELRKWVRLQIDNLNRTQEKRAKK